MKSKTLKPNYSLFPKLFLLLVVFALKSKGAETSIRQDSLTAFSFVVIGTYFEESNAIKHVSRARLYIRDAGYFYNVIKSSYYVFAYKSHDKRATLNKLHQLRLNSFFKEAWYYKHMPEKRLAVKYLKSGPKPVAFQPPAKDSTLPRKPLEKEGVFGSQPPADDRYNVKLEKKSPVVDLHDPFKGDEKNNLVADSRIHAIPPATTSLVDASAIDQLQTAKSGDVIIFNNLLFHRNAAILHRSSESDLNKLLKIMLDNARMKIRIHGHTNGDFRGEIVKMGKRNKDYFEPNSKNDYVQGDAVQLSIERARIISKYLKEKGVLPSRIQTKGWGGQKTIYPLNSADASLNSRVEIEILEK